MRPSPSELGNRELREKYRSYYHRVENKHGVGTKDLRYFSDLGEEVKNRDGQVKSRVKVTFPKEDREPEAVLGLTSGLEDNPYEQAFPEEEEKLLEDIESILQSGLSRPAKAKEVVAQAQVYLDYAKNTEQVADK